MKKSKKIEDENFVVSFYRNHVILVWLFIIIILFVVIMKYFVGDNQIINKKDNVEIKINNSDHLYVVVGSTIHLSVSINVSDAKINWTSNNTNIASVNDGNVLGVNYGQATITATYIDGDNKKYSANCIVEVVDGDPNISLSSIKFQDGDLYMPLNSEYQLALILTPSNALVNEKSFISSDDSIATVSENGLVKSIKEGHTRIITTVNNKKRAVIDVYVGREYHKSEIVLSPTTLSFDGSTRKMKVGSSEKINYNVVPSNIDKSKITWTSSDSNIVTVDQTGKVIAKKEGKAVITIASINGKKDDMVVEVYNDIVPVTDITITTDTIDMASGKTTIITPVVSPNNASNKEFVFSSSDPSIVSITVDKSSTSATLSALKKGNVIITIISGNIQKKVTVNVTGEGNNSEINDDDPKLPTTIKVRSNKNNLAKSYEEAKELPVSGETIVTITLSVGVGKVKYCVNKYGDKLCSPNEEMYADGTVLIPTDGMYVLRVIKYDYNDNEIESTSKNYLDGVLNYYINTNTLEKDYTITGAYENETLSKLYPLKINDKVNITLNNNSKYLKICYTNEENCTPSITIKNNYAISISKSGLWRLYIVEYDSNNKKIDSSVYFIYAK